MTQFETIMIKDSITLHSKLKDIVNSLHILGKKIQKSRVIEKIPRFLPDRFVLKMTVVGLMVLNQGFNPYFYYCNI